MAKKNAKKTKTVKSESQLTNGKTQATEKISGIVNGKKDLSGNLITNVLAKGNEFAIYEIEDEDINDRIRVLIDGHTDQSEKIIVDRYNRAKPGFIEAKGLLYRSSNFGKMKNRIAHTLSTALLADDQDSEQLFRTLINDLNDEFERFTLNRLLYIAPALILTSIAAVIIYNNMDLRLTNDPRWQIYCVLLGSTLGGSLSILAGIGKYSFEEHLKEAFYLLLGGERMFLAGLAGAIAYIGMRSGIVFPQMTLSNYWAVMLIVATAGFSELFVPSLLTNLSTRKLKQGTGK